MPADMWPAGFRFHPTDEELVLYYLKRKICRKRLKLDIIGETDVYKWDPEELPGKSKLRSGDRQWFFFSPRDRRYPNGARSNRATLHGYWKATGKDRIIICNARNVGVKKTLVYYTGRAPSGGRTDWVMHEYTLDEEELQRCQTAGVYDELPCADISFNSTNFTERSVVLHPNSQQYGTGATFDFTKSTTHVSHFFDTREVASTSNISEQDFNLTEEDFLELDDLIGQEPTSVNPSKPIENLQFDEIDGLSEFDLFNNVSMFVSDIGSTDQGTESDAHMSNFDNNMMNRSENQLRGGTGQLNPQLWTDELIGDFLSQEELNTAAISLPNSGGALYENSSSNISSESNRNQIGQVDDIDQNWFTSALWAFVESIPTTPASASESALVVNRAFERMPSFSRVKVNASTSNSITAKKASKNMAFFLVSAIVVLVAIFWVLMKGKDAFVFGRYISL